ncbi:MAG: amidase [Candidatus Rokuibacteriota bacterium]|nr:MAG: amidase [Candidatus Rokubacteria bacterium]
MRSGDPIALHALTAFDAAAGIRAGTVSAAALVEALLARIRTVDPRLEAWVHVDESARAPAAERDAEARRGAIRGPLHGVPVGIKDIFHVAGMPTRAGAGPFAHTTPADDATSVKRLRAAGAIVLGKTHTTEFAFRDPAPTRNPWNRDHTPGGSSSGSGAGVAARMVPLALGSQTVGSVLRPAAYCGVVGLKPTHGLVSADGVIPLAWSLDHVGVFARTVADAALTLGVLAGRSIDVTPTSTPRLALAPELSARAEADVAGQVSAAASAFARAGAVVEEVKLPASFAELHEAGQRVLEAEAAAYHEPTYRDHASEYREGMRELIKTGLAQPVTTYVRANRARLRFRDDVMPVLAAYDALLSPTAPTPAPRGLAWTGDASLCAPWSFSGAPSISLPSGLAASGLPYAIQLTSAAGDEARLLRTAAWCERLLAFSLEPAC